MRPESLLYIEVPYEDVNSHGHGALQYKGIGMNMSTSLAPNR